MMAGSPNPDAEAPMSGPYPDRRELFASSAALFGAAGLAAGQKPDERPRKRYAFKKSINLWAFPYPEKMNLEQCLKLAKTLLGAAKDQHGRLRLRQLLRDAIEEVRVLVVPRGGTRLAMVQVCFEDGVYRSYVIVYKTAGNGRKGGWGVCAFKSTEGILAQAGAVGFIAQHKGGKIALCSGRLQTREEAVKAEEWLKNL